METEAESESRKKLPSPLFSQSSLLDSLCASALQISQVLLLPPFASANLLRARRASNQRQTWRRKGSPALLAGPSLPKRLEEGRFRKAKKGRMSRVHSAETAPTAPGVGRS